jgi:hypothetical protein
VRRLAVSLGAISVIGLLLALAADGGWTRSLPIGTAAATARCQGRYRNAVLPVYDVLVVVYARQHLTCSQATRVGNAVATAYQRYLPTPDYPPLPSGVPGGQGQPFPAHTRFGTFTCVMTARGSDFVVARCRRGARFVRFLSNTSAFLHGQ